MRPRLLSACVAALAAAGFLAGSPRAAADVVPTSAGSSSFVTLQYDGRTANPNVSLTVNGTTYDGSAGHPKISTGPFYWHENELPPNTNFPPPTVTFCVEINPASQPLPVLGSNTDFAVAPLTGGNAAAISELYGRFYNNEPGVDWTNKAAFNGDTASAAFQIALWELVYDTDRNLSTGTFKANFGGSVYTTAQSYLTSLNGSTSYFNSRFAGQELVKLIAPAGGDKSQDNIQDQITLQPKSVPAPPGLILAGLGVVGLIGRARWLRRTGATA